MGAFLCWRLHGPLASWGDVAIAGKRPSATHPSRSAVLGLVGAAVGVRRDDEVSWAALESSFGLASRTDSAGALLIDFHTAQGPDEALIRKQASAAKKAKVGWHRPATRRAELAFSRNDLSTLLSSRQYRVDALWTVALWVRPEVTSTTWSLRDIAAALREPFFLPYLGRKSCPLDLPMEPQLIEAANPVEAMAKARFKTDEFVADLLKKGAEHATVQWEGSWADLNPDQTVRRRDRVLNRSRWQFGEREEHHRSLNPAEENTHVPQSS